jgi:hypothetical protein
LSEENENFELTITDVQGRIILNESIAFGSHNFDISEWSKGVFYVTMTKSNGQRLTKTLVKI